jgi:quercetin dioxygenase-like cupin family protein
MTTIMLPPREGKSVWLGGLGVDFKISGEQTGGAFSVVEHPIEPGRLVPPHLHTREDEFSYVLEGEIGVRIGDEVVLATPGCYVFKPRGIPHTFWNAGPQMGRLIEIIAPAGFEQWFLEVAELFRTGADFSQIEALGVRYGGRSHLEWVPELTEKYHLKLLGQ